MHRSATPKPEGKSRNPAMGSREARYTVGLAPPVATQVRRYAKTCDTSISKAIANLVRAGLENQDSRKREFIRKLKANLETNDAERQAQLAKELRAVTLGR